MTDNKIDINCDGEDEQLSSKYNPRFKRLIRESLYTNNGFNLDGLFHIISAHYLCFILYASQFPFPFLYGILR